MTSESKIYDIPVVVNEKGQNCIDTTIINLILYVNSFGFDAKKDMEYKYRKINIKYFKSKLNYIFYNCLTKGPKPWSNPKTVIGEAPGFDICFDKEKLELAKPYIQELLCQVGDVSYFSDLSILNNGQVWTELKQDIQKLLSLASASGIINYHITNINMYDDNPELTIIR